MKAMLILMAILVTGCASIPPLFGQKEIIKTWHVHPDDMAQFKDDHEKCLRIGRAFESQKALEACLQLKGYRLTQRVE